MTLILQGVNSQSLGEGSTQDNIEEQLKLAREKTSLADQQGAYGSGTSMVAGNIDNTILFIIALVVTFGAVSAAFFIKSRGGRRAVTKQSTRQSEPDWKLEAQRYKEELEAMKENLPSIDHRSIKHIEVYDAKPSEYRILSKKDHFWTRRKYEVVKISKMEEKVTRSRNVNVWIRGRNSGEPVSVGHAYPLIINVGKKKEELLISADAGPLESINRELGKIKLEVVVHTDTSEIKPSLQELILPKSGDSNTITFTLKPKREGRDEIHVLFYYIGNLLLELVAPLEVRVEGMYQTEAPTSERSQMLHTQLILSSSDEFESSRLIDSTI